MTKRIIAFPKRGNTVNAQRMQVALQLPFLYTDEETGDHILLSVSPEYFKISVNRREYYFVRETGEFDGTATMELDRPMMIYDSSDSDGE